MRKNKRLEAKVLELETVCHNIIESLHTAFDGVNANFDDVNKNFAHFNDEVESIRSVVEQLGALQKIQKEVDTFDIEPFKKFLGGNETALDPRRQPRFSIEDLENTVELLQSLQDRHEGSGEYFAGVQDAIDYILDLTDGVDPKKNGRL